MFILKAGVLNKIRRTHNLTSDEKLATKLKVAGRTIQYLRAGRQPTIATLMKIAALTGEYNLDKLVTEKKKKQPK